MITGNTKLAALLKVSKSMAEAYADRVALKRQNQAATESRPLLDQLQKAVADRTAATYTYGARPIDSLPRAPAPERQNRAAPERPSLWERIQGAVARNTTDNYTYRAKSIDSLPARPRAAPAAAAEPARRSGPLLVPTTGSLSVGSTTRPPAFASTPSLAPSVMRHETMPRMQAPVILSRGDIRVPAPAAPTPGPSARDIANLARQIARQSNFRPVGRGNFQNDTAAERFIARNPRFSALARARLGLDR